MTPAIFLLLLIGIAAAACGIYYGTIEMTRRRAIRIASSLHHTRIAFSKEREKHLRKEAKKLEEGILEANKWIIKQGYARCEDVAVREWYRQRGYDVVLEGGTFKIRLPQISTKEISDLITGKTEETQ